MEFEAIGVIGVKGVMGVYVNYSLSVDWLIVEIRVFSSKESSFDQIFFAFIGLFY